MFMLLVIFFAVKLYDGNYIYKINMNLSSKLGLQHIKVSKKHLSSCVNSEKKKKKKKKKAEQFSNYSIQSECHVLQTSLCPIINICFPITSGELKT